ncbi:MAG TPA: hypothetical protein VGO16_02790 [Pseudonocardiaceae bacterium]|nr:hypothetical protein [Pseudonocardiaceae bacterium]
MTASPSHAAPPSDARPCADPATMLAPPRLWSAEMATAIAAGSLLVGSPEGAPPDEPDPAAL